MKFLPFLPTPEGLPEIEKGEYEMLALYSAYRGHKKRSIKAAAKRNKKLIFGLVIFTYLAIAAGTITLQNTLGIESINKIIIGMYIALLPSVLFNLAKYSGPTAIQAGKNGIRFHWAHFYRTYSGPWIKWQDLEYVSSEEIKYSSFKFADKYSSRSFDLTIDLSNADIELVKFLNKLKLFGLHRKCSWSN